MVIINSHQMNSDVEIEKMCELFKVLLGKKLANIYISQFSLSIRAKVLKLDCKRICRDN